MSDKIPNIPVTYIYHNYVLAHDHAETMKKNGFKVIWEGLRDFKVYITYQLIEL